jgi:23S rRNA G2069 N7-methylase RlmK/C1962 C5-methylase RlmI
MYAQEAGASQVISVDASRAANEICIKNFELNDFLLISPKIYISSNTMLYV